MSDFALHVNGSRYSGWQDITLRQGMEEFAHTFSVGYEETRDGGEPVPIRKGDECRISIDGEYVLTGYVDDDELSYDAESHSAKISGRSRTGDLVDCAAIYKTGQWRDRTLAQIAQDLCSPYGVYVGTEADVGAPFRKFAIQDGESVFECLSRAAAMRGVLLLTNGRGDLVLSRAGASRASTTIERGRNVLAGGRKGSLRDRFSNYIGKSQASGDDNFSGKQAASIRQESSDEDVPRYRPMVLLAEQQETGTELQKRVDWERNVRAGKSSRLNYTVQGWFHEAGLWMPNTLVPVVDDWLGVNEELLIVSVVMKRSESGTFTDLELTKAAAFDVLEKPTRDRKKGAAAVSGGGNILTDTVKAIKDGDWW